MWHMTSERLPIFFLFFFSVHFGIVDTIHTHREIQRLPYARFLIKVWEGGAWYSVYPASNWWSLGEYISLMTQEQQKEIKLTHFGTKLEKYLPSEMRYNHSVEVLLVCMGYIYMYIYKYIYIKIYIYIIFFYSVKGLLSTGPTLSRDGRKPKH